MDEPVPDAPADAGFEEETLESLTAKLDEYRENLAGVKEALEASPDEPELEKLVHDLEELVGLYEDLVDIKRRTEPKKPRIEATAPSISNWDSVFGAESVLTARGPRTELPPPPTSKTLVSHACYAPYEGETYTAVIELADHNAQPPTVTVIYIGWGNKETLPLPAIELIPSVPITSCLPGIDGWAITPADGLWRPASIQGRGRDGQVKVRFKESKEVLLLPCDQVTASWGALTTTMRRCHWGHQVRVWLPLVQKRNRTAGDKRKAGGSRRSSLRLEGTISPRH